MLEQQHQVKRPVQQVSSATMILFPNLMGVNTSNQFLIGLQTKLLSQLI